MQRNPATPPFTDSTEVPLLTSPSNVTPSMSTGGSADCSANCSDGSADSSAAGSAGGSAACVGSSADGSNGSGSQGLPPDTGDVEVVLILLDRLFPYCEVFKFSICFLQSPLLGSMLVFATSYLICHFGGVSRESHLKLPSNRNSKSYPEELPIGPQSLFLHFHGHTQPAIHTICLHFWFHTTIFENGANIF